MLKKTRALILTVLTLTLMGSGAVLASAKEKADESFTLQGKVVAVNLKERTMLVKEKRTGQEYVVIVPEESVFKITIGKSARLQQPQLENLSIGDRVSCKVRATGEGADLAKGRRTKTIITKS